MIRTFSASNHQLLNSCVRWQIYDIFDSNEYIIVFQMEEKPVLELRTKHLFSVHGCGGRAVLWSLEFDIIK